MAKVKKTNAGEDVEKLDHSHIAVGIQNSTATLGNDLTFFQNMQLSYDPDFTLGHFPQRN